MARTRDVIIGVIIAVVFVMALGVFGLMFVGLLSQGSDLDFAGLGGNVGLVEVNGVIDETSGREVIKTLDKYDENSSIKAIVLHVNSPGGGVAISQEIYDEIKRVRVDKPVVASMASVAASGGYYISCGADRIIANPGTLTGSIGVIFEFHTFKGLMDKVGIGTETVKSGELKDVGTYSRPMTEEEGLMLRSVVMDTYEQFVQVVADGRGKSPEDIYPLADGSVYTGLQAYNLGLVDTLGGLKEAVDLAANLAGVTGEPKLVRQTDRKKVSIFDLLGNVSNVVNTSIDKSMSGPQLMFLYR
jgi:protease-4